MPIHYYYSQLLGSCQARYWLTQKFGNQYRAHGDKGANGEDVYPQGKGGREPAFVTGFYLRSFAAQNSSRGIIWRGGITAGGAAAGKVFFAAGIAAGGAAYRGEKPAAMRAGFGVPPDFVAAVVAKKTGLFVHYAVLGAAVVGTAGGLCAGGDFSAVVDSGFAALDVLPAGVFPGTLVPGTEVPLPLSVT